MEQRPHYDCPCLEHCPLHYAMSLIGGKWKVQILCALNTGGSLRYNALKKRVVRRTEYLEVPVRVEYAITAEGKTLIPILEQLSDWAEQRMKQEEHA